jgi:hypothetical protein
MSKINKVKSPSFGSNEEPEVKPKSRLQQVFGPPKTLDIENCGKNENHNKINYSPKTDITIKDKK